MTNKNLAVAKPIPRGAEACRAEWPGGTRQPPEGWKSPRMARCTRPQGHQGEHMAIDVKTAYVRARWDR
jgi:hypothetical protein